MSTSDILANGEKMSEAHISIDINENHCQETVVGYPVNSKWFFWSDRQSSNETTNETNVTQHKNDTAQSKDLTKSLLNDETHSNNRTHRIRGRTNSHARSNSDKCSCFDPKTRSGKCFNSVVFLLLVILLIGYFPLLGFLFENPYPLKFMVISLDVSSMTISNNVSVSDIQNNMSADLNLTLSVSNLYNMPLFIEHLVVSIKYFNETISSTKIGPLYEKSKAHETIQLRMGFKEVQVQDTTFDSMLKDLAINRTVEFTVIMQSKYDILDPDHVLRRAGEIICVGSPVQFSPASDLSSGTMVGAPRSCKQTTLTYE